MTYKTPSLAQVMALMTMALSSAAFAGGNHAGGHSHGDEETAIGRPGVAARVNRTITIEMNDSMRYVPADLQVRQGETIRFVVRNVGKVKHELSLGTQQELMEHLEQMKKFPDMEHDEPNKITLAPGKRGEIIWQFTQAGVVNFACLMPGHYEAGMKGVVRVGKR
ncbi:MAG: cupredoxin family protein [Curvibacter sp.]